MRSQRCHDGTEWNEASKHCSVGRSGEHNVRVVRAKDVWNVVETKCRPGAPAGPDDRDDGALADLVSYPSPKKIEEDVGGEHDSENL